MGEDKPDARLRSAMRAAVGGAVEATVGRAGHAARDFSQATVRDYIDDLEPYLIDETVPRIVEGVTPLLVQQVVPEVIDGVTEHLIDVTVPAVLAGLTPALVAELLPRILSDLEPYLQQELAPDLVDALMPKIQAELAPQVVDALMPKIQAELAPQVVDALMPKIQSELAPQVVDALMPKIQAEVVPAILDEIVDDPRVRNLIREQSQGLFLDAIERLRTVAAKVDDATENFGRRIFRRPPRPAASGPGPTLPEGRRIIYAGAVSRSVAFVLDISLVSFSIGLGLNLLLGLQQGFFENSTTSLDGLASLVVLFATPTYFALCWWLAGSTVGDFLMGLRICRRNGERLGFLASWVRSWTLLLFLIVWMVGMLPTAFSRDRRSWLDRVTRTQARYVGRPLWKPLGSGGVTGPAMTAPTQPTADPARPGSGP